MRQSRVVSEDSSLAETVLKMTQGQDDPRKAAIEDHLGLALQVVMQHRRIAYHRIAERFGMFLERAEKKLAEEHGLLKGFCKVGSSCLPIHQDHAQLTPQWFPSGLCSTHESWVKFDSTLTQMSRVRVESAVKIKDMSRVRVESRWSSFES